MTFISIKTIEHDGKQIPLTADETGTVWVGERRASRPVTVGSLTFVWGAKEDGLPSCSKIKLEEDHVRRIEEHSKEYREACEAEARKARDFDETINEGGEGFNPYRQ